MTISLDKGCIELGPYIKDKTLGDCILELLRAKRLFPAFHSEHEGFAIILEELDELKAEIWKNQSKRDRAAIRKEAVQLAAMAMRFVDDLCGED